MRGMLLLLVAAGLAGADTNLETARNLQDRPALEKAIADLSATAQKNPNDPDAHYRVALASSYLGEIGLEVRDKGLAQRAADGGIKAAERAIALNPKNADYHRVLGTLCGQVVPNNILRAFSEGRRAKDELAKAVELDPKSAQNYIARGVGNYYLPPQFGGGPEPAIVDLKKAISLNPKSAEAYLWLGLSYRKLKQNAEARKAIAKSLELEPKRVWAKQQLEKTPPQ